MDSGKAEGREAGPVADEESSVESGRKVPAGGQEDIAEVRRIGLQSSAAGPKFGRGALGEADRQSPATCPRGIEEESINRSAYRDSSRVRGP